MPPQYIRLLRAGDSKPMTSSIDRSEVPKMPQAFLVALCLCLGLSMLVKPTAAFHSKMLQKVERLPALLDGEHQYCEAGYTASPYTMELTSIDGGHLPDQGPLRSLLHGTKKWRGDKGGGKNPTFCFGFKHSRPFLIHSMIERACYVMLSYYLDIVYLETGAACRNEVKGVTLNDVEIPYDWIKEDDGDLLKLDNLMLNASTVLKSEICIEVGQKCADFGFPFYGCRRTAQTAFYLEITSVKTVAVGLSTRICGQIHGDQCCDGEVDSCCSKPVNKLEVHINDACYSKVSDLTYGGEYKGPSYSRYGDDKTVFKVTNLDTDKGGAPQEICFNINTPCVSVSDFCYNGVCDFALIDDSNRCCPGGSLIPTQSVFYGQ
eukprot:gene30466-35477_t